MKSNVQSDHFKHFGVLFFIFIQKGGDCFLIAFIFEVFQKFCLLNRLVIRRIEGLHELVDIFFSDVPLEDGSQEGTDFFTLKGATEISVVCHKGLEDDL